MRCSKLYLHDDVRRDAVSQQLVQPGSDLQKPGTEKDGDSALKYSHKSD